MMQSSFIYYILWYLSVESTPYGGLKFSYALLFGSRFMNKYALLTEPARRGTEMTDSYGRLAAFDAKYCDPRVSHRINRYRNLDKGFLLTIRADNGSTLLETQV